MRAELDMGWVHWFGKNIRFGETEIAGFVTEE